MKERLKGGIVAPVSRISAPVVVNSFGRSGSTVLTQAICESARRTSLVDVRRLLGSAWDLETAMLARHRCYKTHDYPPKRQLGDAKLLYVFGDPIQATASVAQRASRDGEDWFHQHCRHLRVNPSSPRELFQRDSLHITQHLTRWLTEARFDVAFIKYESMWGNESSISDYLGFPVTLPPKRPRQSTLTRDEERRLRSVYSAAIDLVDSLPEWSVHTSVIDKAGPGEQGKGND